MLRLLQRMAVIVCDWPSKRAVGHAGRRADKLGPAKSFIVQHFWGKIWLHMIATGNSKFPILHRMGPWGLLEGGPRLNLLSIFDGAVSRELYVMFRRSQSAFWGHRSTLNFLEYSADFRCGCVTDTRVLLFYTLNKDYLSSVLNIHSAKGHYCAIAAFQNRMIFYLCFCRTWVHVGFVAYSI